MKLVYCKDCQDVFNLTETERSCSCGKTRGRTLDRKKIIVSKDAIPLGIEDAPFKYAVRKRRPSGIGGNFVAFVLPHVNDGLKYYERED